MRVGTNDEKTLNKTMQDRFPNVKREIFEVCPICGGIKYHCYGYIAPEIPETKIDYITQCSCEIEREREIEDIRVSAKIDEESKKAVFNACGMKKLQLEMLEKTFVGGNVKQHQFTMNWARKFNKQTRKGIIYFGNCGVGKTMSACKVAKEVLDGGYLVKFVQSGELYDMIRQSYTTNDKEVYKAIQDYKLCDLFILDDLGTESNNDDSRERITQLLENRMSQMKPTIITTNLNEGDFKKRYGERFVSRTYEHFSKVYFTGNDKRK